MNQFTIFRDIVLILVVSLPIIFIFRKINLPSITGFLIAGMLIGPYGFNIISDSGDIQSMAEMGVILLLFTIGLEVNPASLYKMKKLLLYSGGFQISLSIILPALIFLSLNIPLKLGIFLGMLISLSSTAIVLKILSEKNQVDSPHGKITLGILIFQDLAVVPMFIILPLLGAGQALSIAAFLLQLLLAFGALAVIIILSRFIMPRVLFQLAHLRIREAFTIGTLLLLLGTAYLTHALGLSFAIGAFIAGVILSDSDFTHQVTSEILPLKDIFNSIFFVSIGLLLNINFVLGSLLLITLVVLSIIIFKSLLIFIIIRILKYPVRTAVLTGLALAQVGEFSFVLAQEGMTYHLLESNLYNIFLASSIFTMLLTPLILQLAPLLANKAVKIAPMSVDIAKSKFNDHVIIAGFGLNGRNLARVLKEAGIPYVVIELNPETIKEGKSAGENMIYGDITKEEILLHAGIKTARVIVFAISDPPSTKTALKIAKTNNHSIKAIVRTRYINEIDELILLGADEIIPEEFETSLQIFTKVLEKYHLPLNIIMQQVSILRGESYILLRKEKADVNSFIHLDEILAAGLTSTYFINEDNYHKGKSLEQVNLRAKTDATIIAIVRGNRTISNPSGKDIIESNDTLVITGTHKSVDLAFSLLDSKDKNRNKIMINEITENEKMPVLFIGHGNPMNAIYDNSFTKTLALEGESLKKLNPAAILVVSAHWLSNGTRVSVSPNPPTIHDFSGFPEELFRVQYPAPGAPDLALFTKNLITFTPVEEDNKWGLDHGAWSILKHMFPLADVPVFQLSIDYKKPPRWHFDLANDLKTLRQKNVLIIGSGNIVHNLYLADFSDEAKPFPWAVEFDEIIKSKLISKDYDSLINYKDLGNSYLAVPSNDHYLPLMYAIGLADKEEDLTIIYEEIQNATISMRSFKIGKPV